MDAFRAYRFRLYPSRAQAERLAETFRLCAELYNAALEQRKSSYGRGRFVAYQMQQGELPELRAGIPEFKRIHSQVMQDVLRRLGRAFANYFARVEKKKTDKRIKLAIHDSSLRLAIARLPIHKQETGGRIWSMATSGSRSLARSGPSGIAP